MVVVLTPLPLWTPQWCGRGVGYAQKARGHVPWPRAAESQR